MIERRPRAPRGAASRAAFFHRKVVPAPNEREEGGLGAALHSGIRPPHQAVQTRLADLGLGQAAVATDRVGGMNSARTI
jgi:hypothetical protein